MFWCRFGFHKSPKWSVPTEMKGRQRVVHYGVPISNWENVAWIEQNRTCELCGKYESRKAE